MSKKHDHAAEMFQKCLDAVGKGSHPVCFFDQNPIHLLLNSFFFLSDIKSTPLIISGMDWARHVCSEFVRH